MGLAVLVARGQGSGVRAVGTAMRAVRHRYSSRATGNFLRGGTGVEIPDSQVTSYRDLIAWRKAISLVTTIYTMTMAFPNRELYGLTSQLRRASVSIASNVAEGHGRATAGEFAQFLCQARGSLYELETQIVIARNLSYLTSEDEQNVLTSAGELGRILNGLIGSIRRRKTHQ